MNSLILSLYYIINNFMMILLGKVAPKIIYLFENSLEVEGNNFQIQNTSEIIILITTRW